MNVNRVRYFRGYLGVVSQGHAQQFQGQQPSEELSTLPGVVILSLIVRVMSVQHWKSCGQVCHSGSAADEFMTSEIYCSTTHECSASYSICITTTVQVYVKLVLPVALREVW